MNVVTHSLLGFILLLCAVILLMPLAVIWALNTLFALGIVYSWQSWLAVIIIGVYFKQSIKYSGK